MAEASVHTVANRDAAALFFHLLARAQAEVQAWGLDVWARILRGSMANLAVCDRWRPELAAVCELRGEVQGWGCAITYMQGSMAGLGHVQQVASLWSCCMRTQV